MRLGTPSGLSTMSTGRAVREVRHVLFRQDAADDALVAVAAGHLVADLELALDGDVDLHHLDDAGRQLVALRQALDLLAEVLFADADHAPRGRPGAAPTWSAPVSTRDLAPVLARARRRAPRRSSSSPLARSTLPLSSTSLPVVTLPTSTLLDLAEVAVADDLDLFVAVPLELRALLVLDGLGALVLLGALAARRCAR